MYLQQAVGGCRRPAGWRPGHWGACSPVGWRGIRRLYKPAGDAIGGCCWWPGCRCRCFGCQGERQSERVPTGTDGTDSGGSGRCCRLEPHGSAFPDSHAYARSVVTPARFASSFGNQWCSILVARRRRRTGQDLCRASTGTPIQPACAKAVAPRLPAPEFRLTGPVSVLLRLQIRLEDRHQNQHRRRLRNPVSQVWDAQGTELPTAASSGSAPVAPDSACRCLPSTPATVPQPSVPLRAP